jgi:hypothetical protein
MISLAHAAPDGTDGSSRFFRGVGGGGGTLSCLYKTGLGYCVAVHRLEHRVEQHAIDLQPGPQGASMTERDSRDTSSRHGCQCAHSPTILGSRCVPPAPGMMAKLVSVKPRRALLPAIPITVQERQEV